MALDTLFWQEFPYVTSGSDVEESLGQMGRRVGVTVRLDPAVEGAVTVDNSAGTVETFLSEVAYQTSSTWWYDGVILHVEPQDGLTTRLVISGGLTLYELRSELSRLGLLDDRFPLNATGNGAVIRVIGPEGYVEQVEHLIETLIKTREVAPEAARQVGLFVPRVFHGRPLQSP